MASLPKPLIGLLVASVAFFALYTVALKPSSSGSNGSANSPTAPVYQSAIAKAHQAVTTSAQASVAHGGTVSTTSAPATHTTAAPSTHATVAPKAAHAAKPVAAKPSRATSVKSVLAAISAHKTVALLFFNPAAADDKAVKQELAGLSTHKGAVAKFAVPVSRLSEFGSLTARVPVNATPTLILIDKQGQASSLVGFADRFELSHRISGALSVK
jgi:hypothetical protein